MGPVSQLSSLAVRPSRQFLFATATTDKICNNYLPEDYDRDSAGHIVVGSVHIEAEWDPSDPVAETRWLDTIAPESRHTLVVVAQARLDREEYRRRVAGPYNQL